MIKADILPNQPQGTMVQITQYGDEDSEVKSWVLTWDDAEDLSLELDRVLMKNPGIPNEG